MNSPAVSLFTLGMLHHIIWQMFADVSEECAPSVLGIIGNYKTNLFALFY
jgi:hypothetical protein